ncbi:MAG: DUF5615 family PIN-like protein [Anaerolineales bacterium]
MKILLDTCIWGGVKQALLDAGYDVVWSGDLDKDPGDDEILAWAYREQRILVTLDKDFGELAIVYGQPHAGIVRLAGFSVQNQAGICLKIFANHKDELAGGAILTVDPKRIRIRS